MAVAVAALAVSLVGEATATDPVARLSKGKIRALVNKQITSRAPTLTVRNARNLGGVAAADHLRGDICQAGTIQGFARFNPAGMATVPDASGTGGVAVTRNCGGGTVEALRLGMGVYEIRFNGNPANIAQCGVLMDDGAIVPSNLLMVELEGAGHFTVFSYDVRSDGTSDAPFSCILP